MEVRKKVRPMRFGVTHVTRHDARVREALLSHGPRSSYEIATSDAHQRHMPHTNALRRTRPVRRGR
jgi:hypothetical protein